MTRGRIVSAGVAVLAVVCSPHSGRAQCGPCTAAGYTPASAYNRLSERRLLGRSGGV